MAPSTRSTKLTPEEEAAELRANLEGVQADVGALKKKFDEIDELKVLLKNLTLAVEKNKGV